MRVDKTKETFKLSETDGGHLSLAPTKDPEDYQEELANKIFMIKKNKGHQLKELRKIHRVFWQPRPERIQSLLKDYGVLDDHL